MKNARAGLLLLVVTLGLLMPGVLSPTAAQASESAAPAQWWCIGGGPCAPPTDSPPEPDGRENPSASAMATTIGNVVTDYIWRYSAVLPYDLCDANGCVRVGEVEVTAQITLNGTVHRVEMTARPVSGPRIQPILYRRCAAQNGSLPDTTCGENTSQAVDFHDSTQTYSATTNYNGVDADTYYYVFQWSWNVEGQAGTPSSGQSHFFNCDGSFCSFP